ncbi:MAG: hypothetical protein K9G33_14360 [Sneathiella sp.]|nr:hypothetical protein [Sneathiella sp.]
MRNYIKSVSAFPLRTAAVIILGLSLTACASGMEEKDRMAVDQAKMDAADAKADAARSLAIMEEVKTMNAQTMQAAKDAAAAAQSARESADKAAKIAAELEALYNKQLRK